MDSIQALVLGIVQGLTEFLPISSTGHLRIVPALFGWDDPGAAFTAVVQLGTLAAVLTYFRADLIKITKASLRALRDQSARRDPDAMIGGFIVVGTIPVALLGLAFSSTIEDGFRSLYLIASALIVFSAVIFYADHRGKRTREVESLTMRDGILIGLAQALALVPGVSRSGATISAGLLVGLDRQAAARYSFLLSVPAVALSGLFELRHVGEGGFPVGATMIATVIAFVTGYASIAFLIRFLGTHNLRAFVNYRVALGLAVIALAAAGLIS